MKLRSLACAMALASALGVSTANAVREEPAQTGVTSVAEFVQMWQDRINNQRLPVADPSTWALRNMSRFATFSADRLALAKRATSIQELEALLVTAPVPNGTSLATLMATQPGNISLDGLVPDANVAVPKNDPTTTPTAYADLVFTAVNPCRVFDSRVSQGGSGPFLNNVSRIIDFGPNASYSFQGGSATNCGMPTLVGFSQIAAVMFATSSFSQTGAGYLTFWAASAPDPSATVVSMFYTAGPVQTAFVVSPTDLLSNVFVRGISRISNTEVTVDIVGYFARPKAAALDCVDVLGTSTPAGAGSTNTAAPAPACTAGYTLASIYCSTNSNQTLILGLTSSGCFFNNATGGAASVQAISHCCRTAGR